MIRVAVSVLLGALAGYARRRLAGCATSACPLSANPYINALRSLRRTRRFYTLRREK